METRITARNNPLLQQVRQQILDGSYKLEEMYKLYKSRQLKMPE